MYIHLSAHASSRKEGVKVCTPEPPPSADDASLKLATLHVFPHGARAEAQHIGRLAQREQTIPNRWSRISLQFLAFFCCGFSFL
jgi:hypothetical protein